MHKEPDAITELRRRVHFADNLPDSYVSRSNEKLGKFLSDVLIAYDEAVKELLWTRQLVHDAYYEGAEDNDFNRELERIDTKRGYPSVGSHERKYTWEKSSAYLHLKDKQ